MDRLSSISHPGTTVYPRLDLKSLLLSPMFLQVLKSKVHRAVVTESNLNYVGSITIDEAIMEAADLLEGERVQIVNNNNGARFETYVIRGLRDSGTIGLNGAAARQVQMGDILIIMSYAFMTPEEAREFKPRSVYPDADNKIKL
jgi:aspartate 1-decarboxylase